MQQEDLYRKLAAAYQAAVSECPVTKFHLKVGSCSAMLFFVGDALVKTLLPALIRTENSAELSQSPYHIYIWEGRHHPPSRQLLELFEEHDKQSLIMINNNIYFQYGPQGKILSWVDITKREAFYLVFDSNKLPDYEVSSPFRMIIHWFCESNKLLLVHAAAIAYKGIGALIIGKSGSGKSTTALLSLFNGFDFAGDDYVVLSHKNGQWCAHPIYRSCKLMPDTLPMLPQLLPYKIKANQTQSKQVFILNERSGNLTSSLPIHSLIYPKLNEGTTGQLQRLSIMEALITFATSTILQMPGAGNKMLSELALFCKERPAYSLALSNDCMEIVSYLKYLFQSWQRQLDMAKLTGNCIDA